MTKLRILHISDIHLRSESVDDWRCRAVLGTEWDRNIGELLADGPLDLVCVTGDVAFSGKREEYALATEFIEHLLAATGVRKDHFFVVPGNHDIDRSVNPRDWQAVRDRVRADELAISSWLKEPRGKAPVGLEDRARDAVLARGEQFREWLRSIGRDAIVPERSRHGALGYRVTLKGEKWPFEVHLVGLDSGWLAGAHDDAGRLLLTDDQTMMLAANSDGSPLGGLRIGLIHHPLSDLADGASARRLLSRHLDLLLRGHLHDEAIESSRTPDNELFEVAAGALYEHNTWPNACHTIELELDPQGKIGTTRLRLRGWSRKGFWFDDGSLYKAAPSGRLVIGRVEPPTETPRPPSPFVGREAELGAMAAAIFSDPPVAVAVLGMAGVGKTSLVSEFSRRAAAVLDGGVLIVSMSRRIPTLMDADGIIETIANRLGMPPDSGDLDVTTSARAKKVLVVLENVDDESSARLAARLGNRLKQCALVIVGRWSAIRETPDWRVVRVELPTDNDAYMQLRSDLGEAVFQSIEEAQLRALLHDLGKLPLAISLAAGYLRYGRSPNGFLREIRQRSLDLPPADANDSNKSLAATFKLSHSLIEVALGDRLTEAFVSLGHAARAGFGRAIGAAVAGVAGDEFERIIFDASRLGLLTPSAPHAVGRWVIHPLIAEYLRGVRGNDRGQQRLQQWFFVRLGDEYGSTTGMWADLEAEFDGLLEWLDSLQDEAIPTVLRQGISWFATHGPFGRWMALCERALGLPLEKNLLSEVLWFHAQVALATGDTEVALASAAKKEVLDRESGELQGVALARGLRGDAVAARGNFAEAVRIWRHEELRTYIDIGDERSACVAWGKIAKALETLGDVREARRIREMEQMPVWRKLDDQRGMAITKGEMASALADEGRVHEAIEIMKAEVLPVLSRIRDTKSEAGAQQILASMLTRSRRHDEALDLLNNSVLPRLEVLGHAQAIFGAREQIADIFARKGRVEEANRMRRDLIVEQRRRGNGRAVAVLLGLIGTDLFISGDIDGAIRVYLEEAVPAVAQGDDPLELVKIHLNAAHVLAERARSQDEYRAVQLLQRAYSVAIMHGLPEMQEVVRKISELRQRKHG